MRNAKEKTYSILTETLQELGVEDIDIIVTRPSDNKNGDYSTNVAMTALKPTQKFSSNLKTPFELAEEIVRKIGNANAEFDKIEAVKPGFINFYLSKQYLQSKTKEIILQGQSFGAVNVGKGKKASVEFVSANPTGPLHIGNARGGPLGDTLASILSKAGYQVIREYLHNNVGGQVEKLGESIYFQIHPDQLPKDYEVQYKAPYVKELAKSVKEQMPDNEDFSQEEFIKKAGEIAVEILLSEIIKDCGDMGIKFDKITRESDLKKKAPEVLDELKKFIKEKDGALWFAPNDEFLKDRETVVKKSDGEYTYFASDIVYHKQKFAAGDELVVDIFGSNHSGHVPRLQAIVKALGFDPGKFKVILYQWVQLKRGSEVVRMGKRLGNIITAREVLDEVGKDAFRFFLLLPKYSTHMDFDLDLAKRQASDNPVFYVQYAYSRICSIFKKAGETNFSSADFSLLTQKEELDLICKLVILPEIIEEIAKNFAVNNLTTYVLEVATAFHKFYEAQQVISDDKKLTQARLALLKATQITLKNTLDLLGVSAPEHM
jgi:arginyl-tRNA synthetase